MTIEQEITKFLEANPSEIVKNKNNFWANRYAIGDYRYNESQKKHEITLNCIFKTGEHKPRILSKVGDLHPELLSFLHKKEEIVYFETKEELKECRSFTFKRTKKDGEIYYWTIFPEKDYSEKEENLEKEYQIWSSKLDEGELKEHESKKLIKKADEGEISWYTKVKMKNENNHANTMLMYVPDSMWDKVEFEGWGTLKHWVYNSNKIFNWYDKKHGRKDGDKIQPFLNEEKLNLFKKFSDGEKEVVMYTETETTKEEQKIKIKDLTFSEDYLFDTHEMADVLEESNKIFGRDGHEMAFQSKEAFKFVQMPMGNVVAGINVIKDKEVTLFELYNTYAFWARDLNSTEPNFKVGARIKEEEESKAQEWLDKSYPPNGVCRNEDDLKNKGKTREQITELDISNKGLEGILKLVGFTNLKELCCYNNQLTSLEVFSNLEWLFCSNNKLINLDFLKSAYELRYLNISNCSSLQGSLKPLKDLSHLAWLNISNTNVDEGLESLPKSCWRLFCDSSYEYKSIKIVEELDKSKCAEEKVGYNESKIKYYNLNKWRTDKVNNAVASIIPLERLFVIRSNLKQFLRKWGKDYEVSWYEKPFFSKSKNDDKLTELSQLRNPEEINTYWYVGESGQWVARGAALTGGILAATTDPLAGGILAASSPVIEVFATQMKEKLYQAKQDKWDQFLAEVDTFLDNYNELRGIIKKISVDEEEVQGKVNQTLNCLDKKTKDFLKDYDTDGNGEVDVNEIKEKEKRGRLAQDLAIGEKGSKAWAIVSAIKDLEDIVVEYKKGGSQIEEEAEKSPQTQNPPTNSENTQEQTSYTTVEVKEQEHQHQEQLSAQIQIPPK